MWIAIGRPVIEKLAMAAASPPMTICPSAPMLNSPARKARPMPSPARTSGMEAVSVSEMALMDPTDPSAIATKLRRMVAGATDVAIMMTAPMTSAIKTAARGIRMISRLLPPVSKSGARRARSFSLWAF